MACISIPLAIGAAGTVATGIAGAVSGGPNLPPTPDYGTTEANTLRAQEQLAPSLYADTANTSYGQPAYNQLQLQTLASMVNGGNGLPGTADVGNMANRSLRGANLEDLQNLGPAASSAVLNANPANAALLASLNTNAASGLAAGSGLTPDQTRDVQQQARAAYAARGMGGSNASVDDELLNQFNLGQQLLQQRQNFASSLVGVNQGAVTNPALALIGQNSTAVPIALQSQSQSGPTLFNPAAGNNMATSNYTTGVTAAINTPSPLASLNTAFTGLGNLALAGGTAYKGGLFNGSGSGGSPALNAQGNELAIP